MSEAVSVRLPQAPRAMAPSAVRWGQAVLADVTEVPRAVLQRPAVESMTAVVWALAAAADAEGRTSAALTAGLLAQEAGVGDRVWQKRTAWLRARGWLLHGPGGQRDGWLLVAP
ncbi:hypothetical protein GTR02_13980 [Kineococcus sp. R8]|uniref:hypothetical protein n=1 Tax=Kineococcus siccus TaxID=2696567 RepID=UPI00141224EA|nr:hypothetical protein [Kineococcus siccus]NAZ82925.1 hypothetical protein [Kineococcus siccus]